MSEEAEKVNQERALRVSVIQGNAEDMNALLSGGADVNAADPQGWTPLMLAAKYRRTDIVQILCDRGAAIDTMNQYGRTALRYATVAGDAESVSLLLDRKADPAAAYPDGASLLINAILLGHFSIVEMLLNRGFNPNVSTRFFQATLVSAVPKGERMVRLLLAGADVNGRWQDGSQMGHTALMRAATLSFVEVAALLLENGADVNAVSVRGKTALGYAQSSLTVAWEENDNARAVRAEAVIDLLCRAGAKG